MDFADVITDKRMMARGSIVHCPFAGWIVELRFARTIREPRS
jgi:hypothetical protein